MLPDTVLSLPLKKNEKTGSGGGGDKKKGKNAGKSNGGNNNNKNKKRSAAVVMESSEEESSDDEDDEDAAASDFIVSDNEDSSDEESLVSEEESEQSDMDMSDDGSEGGKKRKKPAAATVAAANKKSKTTVEASKPTTATGTKTPAGVALNASRIGLTPAGLPTTTTTAKKTSAVLSRVNTSATPELVSSEKHAPKTTTTGTANLKDAIQDTGVERFTARDVQRFPWMQADKIRDAKKRRPSDPGYDHTSIYIPPDWFVKEKISAGQRQWWDFKALNWDAVLLFKMGKFYELFEMDAKVGADILGLSFMKGDQPHCGFPEAAYHQMAETLARAGRRVVVIEQTETPDALAVRNEERKKKGLKKESVVRREKVVVLTKGTLNDAGMLATAPEASYLMCLVELPVPTTTATTTNNGNAASDMGEGVMRPKVWVGMCAVDAATGQVLLGQWFDDDSRTQLRNALTALQPVEIVLAHGRASNSAKRVIRGLLRDPIVNVYELGSDRFWTTDTLLENLPSYFNNNNPMPAVLEGIVKDKDGNTAVASALGGCLAYLNDGMLDKQIMAARRFELVSEAYGVGSGGGNKSSRKNDGDVDDSGVTPDSKDIKRLLENKVKHMSLDGAALENLEVLENTEGKLTGTLLAAVDNCVTPAGRRRLRQWLCRPLFSIKDITARQDAIADLMGPAADGAVTARRNFSGLADLERSIARLAAAGAGCGSGRDAPHVILYEDASKKRVQAFSSAIKGLAAIQDAMMKGFQDLLTNNSITSLLLRQLVTPGLLFPAMKLPLEELLTATNWSAAERSGRVVPEQGVDPVYDSTVKTVEAVEQKLEDHLKEVKDHMVSGVSNKSHIKYVSLMKESHVIEVPESAKVPADWEPMQGKKGVKRYSNTILKELAKELESAKNAVEAAQSGILQGLVVKFAQNRDMWLAAVECMAHLDALMSLAMAGSCGSGPMCRPTFLPFPPSSSSSSSEANTIATTPLFIAKSLRHPAEISGLAGEGNFVPNDIQMGCIHGDTNDADASPARSSPSPGFIVLTGPNMGGKSTLMRQVCLASLLAQVGAWVPAASLEMSPVDAIFVRMGARDRIMLGQSTFFVELSETAGALARATQNSLVALDELGRGTATSDGAAIASAVLDHFASTVKCRGIFATHYHHIADSHAEDAAVAIKHMACKVTTPQNTTTTDDHDDGGAVVEEVTFLYKLTQGACPKSYGVNVARLAGLPERIVKRAAVVSSQTQKEREQQEGMGVGGEEEEEELCRAVEAARELLHQL